jgi:hypothetical protein
MARSITIRKSIPLFRTEGESLNEHTFFGPGSYSVVRIPNPIKKGGPAWLKLSAQPWGTAEVLWKAATSEIKKLRPRHSNRVHNCRDSSLQLSAS